MLKLQPNPTFDVDVKVPVPGAQDEPVTLTMRHMGRAAIAEYLARAKSAPECDSISEIVAGWHGVDNAFSQDNLARLLDDYPSLGGRIIQAWMDELVKGPVKN